MLAHLTFEEPLSHSGRAPLSLSTHHPSATFAAASSRALSSLTISTDLTEPLPSVPNTISRWELALTFAQPNVRNRTSVEGADRRIPSYFMVEGAGFETCDRAAGPDRDARECVPEHEEVDGLRRTRDIWSKSPSGGALGTGHVEPRKRQNACGGVAGWI
ncbi:hypothetical protein FS749_005638 [Ceratobasidium sp. UAMH 11750]|nr:hypothetical protein FS749_005638 [Ceratobasidium sp. UAMH 11750]